MATSKGSRTKKSTGGASRGGGGKDRREIPSGPKSGKSNAPLYVLIILVLLTALVLLVNRQGRFPAVAPGDKSTRGTHRTATTVVIPEKEKREQIVEEKQKEEGVLPPEKEKTVQVYFIKIDDRTEKVSLSPVQRKVVEKEQVQDALRELIEGPSGAEQRKGFVTALPGNLRLRSVQIKNKMAVLDFNAALGEGAGGTILLNRLDQIVYTATQFQGIQRVEITINGRRQKTLGADGLSISGPLHRRY
jgi:spore germination protein GerM